MGSRKTLQVSHYYFDDTNYRVHQNLHRLSIIIFCIVKYVFLDGYFNLLPRRRPISLSPPPKCPDMKTEVQK